MKSKMKKANKCLAVILFLCLMLSYGTPVFAETQVLPSGVAYDKLGEKIEEFVSEHEDTTAGMEISVFSQSESIYTNYFGYANKEISLAVDQDTVMEWGSTTKLLVWVSVMQLWEQGRIDLTADVREYLPAGFLPEFNYDTPITMTHLMNHNAGFQEVYADLFIKDHDAIHTLEESLKAHVPEQIYEPGTVTAYSNWGVALAAFIVEQISGKTFDDYVHQHIFEVLNMNHSALSTDLSDNTWVQEKRKELQCYTVDCILIPDCFYYITLYPAGMCTSTLADFETFGMALLDENSLLFEEPDTWQTLFTPTAYLGDSEIPSNYHGFWVVPYGVETVGHGGNTAGCSSYLLLDLQNKIGVVVMTNQAGETVYNSEMMKLIFGEFSSQDYFNTERDMPKGIYRSARTVRVGPFKIISFSFIANDWGRDEFWVMETGNAVEKVCYPYSDFVRVPVWEFVVEVALVVLWIAALLFSIVSLFVKLVRKIICVYKKKQLAIPLGRWSTLVVCAQIVTAILFAIMAVLALNFALSISYIWMSVVMGGMVIFMIGLIIYGTVVILKNETSKKRKFYNLIAVIMLATTVVNIFYWNLFMWWKI